MAVIKRINISLDAEHIFYLECLQNHYREKRKKIPSPQLLLRSLLKESFDTLQAKDKDDLNLKNSSNSKINEKSKINESSSKNVQKKTKKTTKKKQIKSKKTIGTQLKQEVNILEELRKYS